MNNFNHTAAHQSVLDLAVKAQQDTPKGTWLTAAGKHLSTDAQPLGVSTHDAQAGETVSVTVLGTAKMNLKGIATSPVQSGDVVCFDSGSLVVKSAAEANDIKAIILTNTSSDFAEVLVGRTFKSEAALPASCLPTAAAITIDASWDAVPRQYITVSRNGGTPITADLAVDPDAIKNLILLADDGVSYVYFDNDMLGIDVDYSSDGDKQFMTMTIAGACLNGVSVNNNVHDISSGFYEPAYIGIGNAPEILPSAIVPEVNVVAILPTPDVLPEVDIYYALNGADAGEPIFIKSCVKAVVDTP